MEKPGHPNFTPLVGSPAVAHPSVIKVTAKKQIDKFARVYSEHLTGSRERVPARAGDAYKPQAGCMEAADTKERREMAAKPYR